MFLGADVEGLNRMARECESAARVADRVRQVIEAVIAAAWVFGPFGVAFMEFLRSAVLPWLRKVSAGLQGFAKVLKANADDQERVSSASNAGSLSAYRTPPFVAVAPFAALSVRDPKLAWAKQELPANQEPAPKQGQARIGDKSSPNENKAVGAIDGRIQRGSPEFTGLVRNDNPSIVFKDEERTGADRMMTPRMRDGLNRLAALVEKEWPGQHLRVTEAWDENGEHRAGSLHYEGRGADLNVSDRDPRKLGRLYQLANQAGLDWVYYEDNRHVHVSVRRGQ